MANSVLKILVVYYSRTGNTRAVATAIAQALEADTLELVDETQRAGVFGFLRGGRDAFLKRTTTLALSDTNLAAYDCVIVGTPVWANSMTPAVRTWLTENKSCASRAAYFCTTACSGIDKTLAAMEALLGVKAVATVGFREKEIKTGAMDAALNTFVELVCSSDNSEG